MRGDGASLFPTGVRLVGWALKQVPIGLKSELAPDSSIWLHFLSENLRPLFRKMLRGEPPPNLKPGSALAYKCNGLKPARPCSRPSRNPTAFDLAASSSRRCRSAARG